MNLMTILVKKVFISSKPTFVYLLCPPLCGPFSIQESAAGGLSYKVKKNVPWHILAPRAVACDNLHLRASAHLWHVSTFLCNRKFQGIPCYIKKAVVHKRDRQPALPPKLAPTLYGNSPLISVNAGSTLYLAM